MVKIRVWVRIGIRIRVWVRIRIKARERVRLILIINLILTIGIEPKVGPRSGSFAQFGSHLKDTIAKASLANQVSARIIFPIARLFPQLEHKRRAIGVGVSIGLSV